MNGTSCRRQSPSCLKYVNDSHTPNDKHKLLQPTMLGACDRLYTGSDVHCCCLENKDTTTQDAPLRESNIVRKIAKDMIIISYNISGELNKHFVSDVLFKCID